MITASRPSLCRGIAIYRALLVSLLCFAALSVADTKDAHAYAWMIRHDYSACGTCHADPSGGELLTKYGRVTAQLLLSSQYGSGSEEEGEAGGESSGELEGPKPGLFWGAVDLPDWLLLSGSYRNLYLIRPGSDKVFTFVPVMQADLYGQMRFGPVSMGGSLGMAKVAAGSSHARAAFVTHGGGGKLNLISRTHYLGVDIGDFVVRGGRLNLPYGVRIPEHTAWVREATRTDRESDQQHGVALAYVGENLRAEVMAIAGNFQTKLDPVPGSRYEDMKGHAIHERGYSMYIEGIGSPTFAAGVSSKVTYVRLDRISKEEESLRQAHGMTMRWGMTQNFSLLAEMNALFRSRASAGYAGFAQFDYEPWQGLHFIATGEVLDQGRLNTSTEAVDKGLGKPKLGAWFGLDWFFYKQLEFRTDLMFRQTESPTIMGQLHMYL